jgi:hypothetical protein
MSITEEIIQALQAVVTPELKALQERVDANHRETQLRFDGINAEMQLHFDGVYARFDALLDWVTLERRLESIKRDLESKRTTPKW